MDECRLHEIRNTMFFVRASPTREQRVTSSIVFHVIGIHPSFIGMICWWAKNSFDPPYGCKISYQAPEESFSVIYPTFRLHIDYPKPVIGIGFVFSLRNIQ